MTTSQKPVVIGALAFLLGISLGAGLPDLDLRILHTHRSIITHGLPVFVLWWVARVADRRDMRLFVIGFAIASAIHLSFDLFPRAWMGYALINIPLIGNTHPVFSWVWIAVCIVVSFYVALALMDRLHDLVTALLGFILVFSMSTGAEQSLFRPVLTMIIAFAVACWLPTHITTQLRQKIVR